MKGVQCYELFGGIALKNHTFSFSRMSSILRTKLMASKSRLDFGGKYQQQNMAVIEAAFLVALRIAKAKKPHTIDQ